MRGDNVYAALANAVLLAAVMPTHGGCQLVEIAQLPVTIESGRALVPAKVNGQDVTMMPQWGSGRGAQRSECSGKRSEQRIQRPPGFRHKLCADGFVSASDSAIRSLDSSASR